MSRSGWRYEGVAHKFVSRGRSVAERKASWAAAVAQRTDELASLQVWRLQLL